MQQAEQDLNSYNKAWTSKIETISKRYQSKVTEFQSEEHTMTIAQKEIMIKEIQDLEVDFSAIDFGSRDSVLSTAKAFEDLGVSAYNGAGKLIVNDQYLLLAGKIVSVEARHAALIRDLIENGTFADSTVIDTNGLDKSRTPAEVLSIAGVYLKTKINASNLPTS